MVMFYVLLYTEMFLLKFVLYIKGYFKNRLPKVIILAFEICVNFSHAVIALGIC